LPAAPGTILARSAGADARTLIRAPRVHRASFTAMGIDHYKNFPVAALPGAAAPRMACIDSAR